MTGEKHEINYFSCHSQGISDAIGLHLPTGACRKIRFRCVSSLYRRQYRRPYFYCELTALYWAWKNLSADYIGLAHYRRHFSLRKPIFSTKDKFSYVLTSEEAAALLKKYDIILPKKRNYFIETGYSHYIHAHPAEPLDKLRELLCEQYPEYVSSFDAAMTSTSSHRFNMFLMKRNYFNAYCNWLFSILFALEKRIDISSYDTYNQRVYGFLAERLLDVWLLKNALVYREIDVLFMENEHWLKKITAFLKRKFFPAKKS